MADGAAPARRPAFGTRDPDHFEPIEIDEAALRRAAFAAEERARAAPQPEAETLAPALKPVVPTDKSLRVAWLLWLVTGIAGGHRFYLRRPISGAIQAVLFLGCWGATLAGRFEAFAGIALSCLWMSADALLMARLHRDSGRE
ncbi:MAG TPA: TM2 domain-containing protein [Allosphingosinicella sp.]|nr:TM2 domain-containing protein [Allosphingosinicella sp.]